MGNICPANKGEGSGGGHGNPYKSRSNHSNHSHHAYKLSANQKLINGANNHDQYPIIGNNGNVLTNSSAILNSNNNNNNNNNNIILSSLHHQNSNVNSAILSSQSQNGFSNNTNSSKLNNSNMNNGGLIVTNGLVVNGLTEKPNYIALFDYESATKDDMTIKKNDQLIVMDKSHPDWWLARNLRTKDTGYVPFNYITSIDDLQIKEWFFPNTSRREAERLLEYLDNEPGVFLIRESEQDNGKCWSLSILDYNEEKQRHTKHYRIRKIDSGGCFISTRNRFDSLDELVSFYSRSANGLCRTLTKPCLKVTSFVGFKDVWEEDRVNIKLGPIIGAGNFGEVYKGLWRDRFVVAIKTLKFNDQEKRNSKKEEMRKEEFRKELEIMKKLRHEKLVKLWCVCTIGEPVFIVTEYMCNGSLLKYMRELEGVNLNFKEIIDMAAQIACGMKYLEGSRCVHRDLAARNILVGERNIVKIADFGFAQMLNANDKLELSQDESNKFPVKWTAPEVFTVDQNTGLRAYTIKSDVWSFGILLYELITLGANPYPGMTHPQVIYEVKENNYRMPKPQGTLCTEAYYAMMLKCWHEDPHQRPTFDSLYHFFNDYFINTQPCYRNPGEP